MKSLTIFADEEAVYEYSKDITLDAAQLEFLDKMDSDMERGIKIRGRLITNPDTKQRATFVTMNLIRAFQQGNDAIISVSCAYLVNRLPALIEVHANNQDGIIDIDFVEEH